MNDSKKAMLRLFGFNAEVDRVEKGLCAICGSKKVKPEDFQDEISRREVELSGYCQVCQYKTFR